MNMTDAGPYHTSAAGIDDVEARYHEFMKEIHDLELPSLRKVPANCPACDVSFELINGRVNGRAWHSHELDVKHCEARKILPTLEKWHDVHRQMKSSTAAAFQLESWEASLKNQSFVDRIIVTCNRCKYFIGTFAPFYVR